MLHPYTYKILTMLQFVGLRMRLFNAKLSYILRVVEPTQRPKQSDVWHKKRDPRNCSVNSFDTFSTYCPVDHTHTSTHS